MILSIYKVIEKSTGRTFYDLELNNFVCALAIEQGLIGIIKRIEESSASLLHNDLIPLPDFYAKDIGIYETIFIASFEFEDARDLRFRLRSVIKSIFPELFI